MDLEQAQKNLNASDPDTLLSALKILKKDGKLSDLQQIISLIKNTNLSVNFPVIQASSAVIKENLINHFHELQPAVREKLGLLLQSLDPFFVNEIGNDLYSENEEHRQIALQILGLLKKNPQLREILAKLIHNRNVKIRATAVNLLSKFIGPNNYYIILSLLNDKDLRVRANTIEALENLNNKRIVPILLRFRKDKNNRIRGNVLKALFTLGYYDIESDLLEMLNSPNHLMQASAIWVVSKINFITKNIEDAIAYRLLSDHELIYSNEKNLLSSLESPRTTGCLNYL